VDEILRILLVEDNAGDARLVEECAARTALIRCSLEKAETVAQGLGLLREKPFDVVLLDYHLPDMNGLDALRMFREEGFDAPIIMLTSVTDPQIAVELMKAGAQDYLSKDELLTTVLPRAIRNAHERFGLRRRIRQERLEHKQVKSIAARLRRRNRELSVIHGISSASGPGVKPRRFMQACLDTLDDALEIEQAFIALRDGDSLSLAIQKGVGAETAEALAANGMELVRRLEKAVREEDAVEWQAPGGSRAVLLFPMCWQEGGVLGALGVLPGRMVAGIGDTDLALLSAASQHMALMLENIEHMRQLRRQARFRAELDLARTVQADLVPKGGVTVGGLAAVGLVHQAEIVGGDYFDFIRMDDQRMAVAVADASGKGFSAALVIAMVAASVDSLAAVNTSPSHVLSVINRTICERTASSRFVTAFYGVWDGEAGVLRACNAGYVPPVWIRASDGAIERLTEAGPALGFVDDLIPLVKCYSLHLEQGDCVCLFSDGLVTLMNAAEGPPLDAEQVWGIIRNNRDQPLEEVAAAIDERVAQHLRVLPQMDDLTMVLLRKE